MKYSPYSYNFFNTSSILQHSVQHDPTQIQFYLSAFPHSVRQYSGELIIKKLAINIVSRIMPALSIRIICSSINKSGVRINRGKLISQNCVCPNRTQSPL